MARFSSSGIVRQRFIAVLLGGMASLSLIGGMARAQEAAVGPAAAPSATEAEIIAAAPELFGFLKSSFPTEFDGFVDQVEARVAKGESLDGMVMEHLLALRSTYAVHLATASDAALSALLDASIDLQQAVLAGEGPATCGNFAINGPGVFDGTPAAAKYEDLMMAQAVLLLSAAKGGHDAPVERAPAAEADWKVITDLMVQAGATQEGFQAISTMDAANPALCPTLELMLEAMNSETTGAGARVRAQYLVELGTL